MDKHTRFRQRHRHYSIRSSDSAAAAAMDRLVAIHGTQKAAFEWALKQASPEPAPATYGDALDRVAGQGRL